MNVERDYIRPALEAVEPWLYLLPSDVQRKLKLALSILETNGCATAEELREQLGEHWVIARRTPRIVKKYGKDVCCYSPKQYETAERRAIEKRFP